MISNPKKVPKHSNTTIYVRNFLAIFVIVSFMAYIHFQLDEARMPVQQTNAIIEAMLKNQSYSLGQEKLRRIEKSYEDKEYESMKQGECLLRIYLDVLKNDEFTANIQEKASIPGFFSWDSKVQLNFTQLNFPSTVHDLQNFKNCSDILALINYLNPQKIDFLYTKHMQKKYGDFSSSQQQTKPKGLKQLQFCVFVHQFNTSTTKLRNNIQSILQQNYDNYNLIVVDDGSLDGSYEISKIILQDFTEELVKQNPNQQKAINQRYQVVKELRRVNNWWALLNKHQKLCRNSDYVVIIDGRDQLSSRYALSILNKQIQQSKVKPDFVTSSILKRKQLSRQYPLRPQNLNNTKAWPSHIFKVLSKDMILPLNQQLPQLSGQLSQPFTTQKSVIQKIYSLTYQKSKPILQIDEMLYVYDSLNSKNNDRNQYFMSIVKQEIQKVKKTQAKSK